MFLSPIDSKHLESIPSLVKKSSLSEILSHCQNLSKVVQVPSFPYTFAGIHCALEGKISDASALLEMDATNSFSASLRNYLAKYNDISPQYLPFSDRRPFNVWLKSTFYKEYSKRVVDHVQSLSERFLKLDTSTPSIIDIGPGNGVLLSQIVNRLVTENDLTSVKLVLIDSSNDMLEAASDFCKKYIKCNVEIQSYNSPIEDMDSETMTELSRYPHWFIHASASLHHLPYEGKISVLRNLKNLSNHLLITEYHANNDMPKDGSPDLFYSVTEFYRYYIDDILKTDASFEEIELWINHLTLAEALHIFTNPYSKRRDYHTTLEHWIEVAKKASHIPLDSTVLLTNGNSPLIYSLLTSTASYE